MPTPRQLAFLKQALAARKAPELKAAPAHFLLISRFAYGADILRRIAQEGSKVTLYIEHPEYQDLWPLTEN